MAGFAKIGPIEGQSTDKNHDKWINIESVSSPVSRSITDGAADQARTRGTTTLHDIVLTRPLDKSSVKLAEACAKGTLFDKVQIHLSTQIKEQEEPYLKYDLENVIITSYSFNGSASGSPQPMESITLNFTKINWTYVTIDPGTGDKKGNVVASYDLGKKS
jgi:type VI secretion system secreted protein Hcp